MLNSMCSHSCCGPGWQNRGCQSNGSDIHTHSYEAMWVKCFHRGRNDRDSDAAGFKPATLWSSSWAYSHALTLPVHRTPSPWFRDSTPGEFVPGDFLAFLALLSFQLTHMCGRNAARARSGCCSGITNKITVSINIVKSLGAVVAKTLLGALVYPEQRKVLCPVRALHYLWSLSFSLSMRHLFSSIVFLLAEALLSLTIWKVLDDPESEGGNACDNHCNVWSPASEMTNKVWDCSSRELDFLLFIADY